jgi:NADH-quinone oxidoreductase subunit C
MTSGAASRSPSGFGPPRIDTRAANWHNAVAEARADGFTYFDFLTAVDNEAEGIDVVVHLLSLQPSDLPPTDPPPTEPLRDLLVRTSLPADQPSIASISDLFAGAAWHERETAEMFGVAFEGHPDPSHLLLADGFEGHPLRKDFALAARNEIEWPGIKDPTKDRR